MAEFGTIIFNGIPTFGARFVQRRGIHPSRCILRVVPQTGLEGQVGTLRITYSGVIDLLMPQCAVREVTPMLVDNVHGHRYEMIVEDRRWKWRYPKIDGVYNERHPDGSVKSYTDLMGGSVRKTARELATILLTALGDGAANVSAVPDTAYPTVVWQGANAAQELEWLLGRFGLTLVLKRDNTVQVVPLHDDSGQALPVAGVLAPVQLHDWKSSTVPSSIRIQGSPTVFQSKLTLSPVRFEPQAAWEIDPDNWPHWMSEVHELNRTEAFLSGYRYFYVTAGWDSDGEVVNDFRQLEFLDQLMEVYDIDDSVDVSVQEWTKLRPVIAGDFWRYDELGTTTSDEIYTGGWSWLPGTQIIQTDRPLFTINGTAVEDPTLYLYVAYRVRKADGSGYVSYTRDKSVVGAPVSTDPQVVHVPELHKGLLKDSPWGTTIADVVPDDEADAYLDELVKVYQYTNASAFWYNGFLNLDLDGALSQMTYICGEYGRGNLAYTLLGRHTEPDFEAPTSAALYQTTALGQVRERARL